jgi:hypothetical protein
MVKKGCSFLTFGIAEQLKTLFETTDIFKHMRSECATDLNDISDVTSGSEYKKLGIAFPQSVSLTCNTDGVPLFSSSNSSLWPVYFMINELPLALRRVNIMLSALWMGLSKPRMDTLFKPIVDSLHCLHKSGVSWMHNGKLVITKAYVCLLSCDSVARPLLQNLKQFNGEYGCSFCLNPGITVQKGHGHVRVYKATVESEERTNEGMLLHATQAVKDDKCVFGVKGASILSLMPNFDLAKGFFPDYMHAVLLGVVRQFVYLWFDTASHSKPYYLGRSLTEIDKIIIALKPPSEIKRMPRSLTVRKYWKAAEWRNFLLFYSSVCLQSFLPHNFLNHWRLLVYAVYNLMLQPIAPATITFCDLALHKFVVLVGELYGEEFMSYNVHLLTHLSTAVKRWGPLWANSCFLFEDANGKLLRYFHGTRGVSSQIFRAFIGTSQLRQLAKLYIDNSCADYLLSKFTNMSAFCSSAVRIGNGVVALGHGRRRLLTMTEYVAVCDLFHCTCLTSTAVTEFSRVVVNGTLLNTQAYSQSLKTQDCCITLRSTPGVFLICGFVVVEFETVSEFIIVVNKLADSSVNCSDADVGINLTSHIRKIETVCENIIAVRSMDIGVKLFLLTDITGSRFTITVPQFEID